MFGGESGQVARILATGRADQGRIRSSRRARLTARGRATLLAVAGAVSFAVGFATPRVLRPSLDLAVSAAAAPDSVDVAAGAPRSVARPALLSPELLGRLPAPDPEWLADRAKSSDPDPTGRWSVVGGRIAERVPLPSDEEGPPGPLRFEYSLDAVLGARVLYRFRRARVQLGHAIVLDPRSGRVLAYVSSDRERLPATKTYPAASLVKVVTAAAALHHAPERAREVCRYRGSPYRLTRSRIHRPAYGNEVSLARALATSNNQCFAQLAVGALGGEALLGAIARFGLLEPPAVGHAAGSATVGEDEYDLGKLGCGLGGCQITPLHAAQLAATLAQGERVEPWWVDRVVDAEGDSVTLPERSAPRRVMTAELADELRTMLVLTTTRGTARSAFRDSRGRPKLGEILVAGKTGNLSGKDPKGRYEWFIGVAPADEPTIAIAVLQVQGSLWWMRSSEIAADILVEVFCDKRRCTPELAARFTGDLGARVAPTFLSARPTESVGPTESVDAALDAGAGHPSTPHAASAGAPHAEQRPDPDSGARHAEQPGPAVPAEVHTGPVAVR